MRSLDFEDKPDYAFLKGLFTKMLTTRPGETLLRAYDWENFAEYKPYKYSVESSKVNTQITRSDFEALRGESSITSPLQNAHEPFRADLKSGAPRLSGGDLASRINFLGLPNNLASFQGSSQNLTLDTSKLNNYQSESHEDVKRSSFLHNLNCRRPSSESQDENEFNYLHMIAENEQSRLSKVSKSVAEQSNYIESHEERRRAPIHILVAKKSYKN